jgi:hypothetical protein
MFITKKTAIEFVGKSGRFKVMQWRSIGFFKGLGELLLSQKPCKVKACY